MEIYNACKEGNVIKFLSLIEQDRPVYIIDWGLVLTYSCNSGNSKLVEIVLNKYEYNNELLYNLWPPEGILNHCLYSSCFNGKIEIAKLLMKDRTCNYNELMYAACRGGHRDIVDLMISHGANNYTWAIHGAIEKNHMDIADYLISLGADVDSVIPKYKFKYLIHRILKNKYLVYKDIENIKHLNCNDDINFKICNYLSSIQSSR